MSVTKNTTKDNAKSGTIKKANTKKAAMKNVGHEIAEFGVKNMQPGSKASHGSKKSSLDKPKTNIGSNEPTRKGGLLKAGSGNNNHAGTKKKSF